jgi:hypothetical protein
MYAGHRRVCGMFFGVIAVLTLTACAPEVRRKPVDFTPLPAGDPVAIYTLKNDVAVTPATGYSRNLARRLAMAPDRAHPAGRSAASAVGRLHG